MSGSGKKVKGEVALDPALQARLLAQMRQEQAVAMRRRALKRYLLLPASIVITVGSLVMSLSSDPMTAVLGQTTASIALFVVWRQRKRIAAALGFG